MASPTVDAIDFLLVSLGIAPLKVIAYMWWRWRKKNREDALTKALHDALQKPEEG